MSEIKLLSCPFCGEYKYIRLVYRDQRHNMSLGDRKNYGVMCMEGCGSEINPIYETKELAIKAWNTRTPSPIVIEWPKRKSTDKKKMFFTEEETMKANSWNACHDAFMSVIKMKGLL